MVILMNNPVIKELEEKTGRSKQECIVINSCLENHFIIGQNNRKKIVDDLMESLSIDEKEADDIYNISMEIIAKRIKNKIFHPFKSKDE